MEKFKFSVSFEELFMDEKLLLDLKTTLKRLNMKLTRRLAIDED